MKEFFREDSKLSMTRLLSMLVVVAGLSVGIIAAVKGNATTSVTAIALGFVSAGLGTKIAQKFKEK